MNQANQHDAPVIPANGVTPAHLTILVVEDEPNMQELLILLLTQERYHVLSASSGERALALLDEQQQVPQVLVLDYQLAGAMNGIELYDRLHARPGWHHIPAIVMSAYPPEEDIARRHLIGLPKPIDIDVLLARVAAALSTAMATKS